MPSSNLRPPLLAAALSGGLIFSAMLSGSAYAEGAAVFASVTNAGEERRLKAKVEADLEIKLSTSSVWVDATNWTRLHSAVMPEQDARALVARARGKGYEAWYNSSGNRWASTADEAPRIGSTGSSATTQRPSASSESSADSVSDYERQTDWGGVEPASGDISHLPMAETFPID